MKKRVLITGASGMVGTALQRFLMYRGHALKTLSRARSTDKEHTYHWDVNLGKIDEKSLDDVDAIIHLAGANVAQKWSTVHKKNIIDSRTKSTQLLSDALFKHNHTVKTFISASAIGYYGNGGAADCFMESDEVIADGFLADVVRRWEREVDNMTSLHMSVKKVRIGLVLHRDNGLLPKIAQPIRWGLGAYIGNGNQYMSWIHYHDLCNIFQHLLDDNAEAGIYNAVAPHPVTNRAFVDAVAYRLGKPIRLPPVPKSLLRLTMGERSELLLKGVKVSSQKIEQIGFKFRYPLLEKALVDLLDN